MQTSSKNMCSYINICIFLVLLGILAS